MLQVRDCRLIGLGSLALNLDHVRNTIRGYFEDLMTIGVTGAISSMRHALSFHLSSKCHAHPQIYLSFIVYVLRLITLAMIIQIIIQRLSLHSVSTLSHTVSVYQFQKLTECLHGQ